MREILSSSVICAIIFVIIEIVRDNSMFRIIGIADSRRQDLWEIKNMWHM